MNISKLTFTGFFLLIAQMGFSQIVDSAKKIAIKDDPYSNKKQHNEIQQKQLKNKPVVLPAVDSTAPPAANKNRKKKHISKHKKSN